MQTEINHCPNPYDVPHHYLHYRQREGLFQVELDGTILIAGKSIRLPGVMVGGIVSVTYEIGDCLEYEEGACCPHSNNGEVRILGYTLG